MKKILYAFLVSLCITSCSVEVDPTDQYSDVVAWQNEEYLDLYVKGFYAGLRDNAEITSNMFSDGYSDILKYSVSNLNSSTDQNKILQQENVITPSNGMLCTWGNYDRIKRLNEFLHDVDAKTGHIDPEFVKVRKAEVRFLRAYLYYKMIRNHGGVILRLENTGVDGGLDNEKDAVKARLTEAESWNFVISELEAIAPDMAGKVKWEDEELGRVTQGAVYALLTRCALYAKQYDKV
ncbi:MAG: RagB/SusD family nutrient uptake outer membrane protein, partial [Prolixibacteraceae bacterium]|nr:RagB/SusD family nutrient uptake outer membrane protein [Prolixibacteraceae bacterium]